MVYLIVVWMAATGPYTQHGDAISIGPMKASVCSTADAKELANTFHSKANIAPTEQLVEAGCLPAERIALLGQFYGCQAYDHAGSVWMYSCDRALGGP